MNNTILSASGFYGQDSTCTSDHSLTRQNSVQEKRNTPPDEREDKDDKHVHIHSEETKSFNGTECAANVSCSIKEDEMDLTDQEAKILEQLGPPPDGGLAAWGVVTGSFVVLFVQIGFIMSIGQLLQYYGVSTVLFSLCFPTTGCWIDTADVRDHLAATPTVTVSSIYHFLAGLHLSDLRVWPRNGVWSVL